MPQTTQQEPLDKIIGLQGAKVLYADLRDRISQHEANTQTMTMSEVQDLINEVDVVRTVDYAAKLHEINS